jgi:hypothetical protein
MELDGYGYICDWIMLATGFARKIQATMDLTDNMNDHDRKESE